jgi:hypothetical protein
MELSCANLGIWYVVQVALGIACIIGLIAMSIMLITLAINTVYDTRRRYHD